MDESNDAFPPGTLVIQDHEGPEMSVSIVVDNGLFEPMVAPRLAPEYRQHCHERLSAGALHVLLVLDYHSDGSGDFYFQDTDSPLGRPVHFPLYTIGRKIRRAQALCLSREIETVMCETLANDLRHAHFFGYSERQKGLLELVNLLEHYKSGKALDEYVSILPKGGNPDMRERFWRELLVALPRGWLMAKTTPAACGGFLCGGKEVV